MWKLIRLEWKKNNIIKYMWKALIMTFILGIFILAAAGELENGEKVLTYGSSMLKSSVELFTNICFILLTSVMLASFIVSAYQNKTMNLMFSYPINRKKILASQMLAVWIFNVTALVLAKVLLYSVLVMSKKYMHITAAGIELGSGMFYVEILIGSAVMVSISFIALLVGLWAKSSKAAIVAGVIIVCVTQGNIGAYTLLDNMPFHAALLMISAAAVFLTLYKVETKDV